MLQTRCFDSIRVMWLNYELNPVDDLFSVILELDVKFSPLGENCALATIQSVDCHATTIFTIGLNFAKVRNRGFHLPVFGQESSQW